MENMKTAVECQIKPTSALVMMWAQEIYRQPETQKYLELLDLSPGGELHQSCKQICHWYGEVILNRKYLIHKLIEEVLEEGTQPYQLLILGAGMCPLPLQLLNRYPDKISRVIEVDLQFMPQKQVLYQEILPYQDTIRCLELDIKSPDLVEQLKFRGDYKIEEPSIIVLEGVSYYLSPQILEDLFRNLRSPQKQNIIILEYLLPYHKIDITRRHLAHDIFRTIEKSCDLSQITTLTPEEIDVLLKDVGGDLTDHYTMKDMEWMRKGMNKYFRRTSQGWIECIRGRI